VLTAYDEHHKLSTDAYAHSEPPLGLPDKSGMDATALGAATGLQVGTINAWVARGHVPNITADARGRLRNFDIDAATHIAVMVELSRFGFGAPLATVCAMIAIGHFREDRGNGLSLIAHPIQEGVDILPSDDLPVPYKARLGFAIKSFKSERDIPKALKSLLGARPSAYLIVNVKEIRAKMQRAEDEWQRATASSASGQKTGRSRRSRARSAAVSNAKDN
jgi:hypothetical protein